MSAHGYVQVGEQHPEEPSAKKDAPPQLLRPTKSKAEQIAAIKAKVRRSTTVTSVPQTVMLLMTMFHCSLRPCKTKLMRTPSKPLVSASFRAICKAEVAHQGTGLSISSTAQRIRPLQVEYPQDHEDGG